MSDYNRGLMAGQENMRRTLEEVSILKNKYLDENEKLTNMLLKAEELAIFGELEQKVIDWAEKKEIFEKSNPTKLFEKFKEESEEFGYELYLITIGSALSDIPLRLKLGDVLVILVLLAKINNTSFAECMQLAYDKISKRTGTMID